MNRFYQDFLYCVVYFFGLWTGQGSKNIYLNLVGFIIGLSLIEIISQIAKQLGDRR